MFGGKQGMAHARQKQIEHWERIISQPLDEYYLNSVEKIGKTHYRLGLKPQSYIGGYTFLIAQMFDDLYDSFHKSGLFSGMSARKKQEFKQAFSALFKIAMLDMATVINLYLEEEKTARDSMLHEIQTSVDHTSKNVDTIAAAAEEMSQNMTVITEQVKSVSDQTELSYQQAQSTNETVQRLEEASASIAQVVTLIHDIADQTHLLSLNATIEASRSGEAGKGFAVVAHEVKNLANQTHDAISGISEKVNMIRSVTDHTAAAIQQILTKITETNQNSQEMRHNIDEQIKAISDVTKSIGGVSESARSVTERVRQMRHA
jgi:uncharacterized protein YoxC